jgi:hypothetical protein
MEGAELNVTETKQLATYRQTVTPADQGSVSEIFATLVRLYRKGNLTGSLIINFNQGGVRNFVADQLAIVPEGSDADKVFDKFFGK